MSSDWLFLVPQIIQHTLEPETRNLLTSDNYSYLRKLLEVVRERGNSAGEKKGGESGEGVWRENGASRVSGEGKGGS